MSTLTLPKAVRLSYTNLLEPRAQAPDKPDDLRYGTAILIPKSDTESVDLVKAAIAEALAEGVTKKWGGKTPKGLKNPLRDGDEEREDENYAGHWFINTKGPKAGKEKPILVGPDSNPTDDSTVIYSGVMARVSLQFYPFDVNGNRGIAAGVSAVMSLGTGEPLGNTVTLKSALAAFGVETPTSKAVDAFAESAKPSEAAGSTAVADDDEADPDDPWAT
jgi:hypothetical protein